MASRQPTRASTARQRILTAAKEELVATGELEVAGVCRRAGVSIGLPYRYFENRSALLVAVVDEFYLQLWQSALGAEYPQSSWAEREQARIKDWVAFLYTEPLSVLVLGGLTGDSAVAAANQRQLREITDVGAANIAHAQRNGELDASRDPQLLSAAVLAGVHATTATALERDERPAPHDLAIEIWLFVKGAVGLRN